MGTDDENEVAISIIIPAYNEASYICECVTSALQQKCEQEFEVLVCDDNSTDQTREIVDELRKDYERLNVIYNSTNEGIITTVNKLTDAAQGKFMLRIDADSVLIPGTLEAMYEKFVTGYDLIFGRVQVKNTSYLHPAAAEVGKRRNRGTWYGGACFGVNRLEFVQSGGFKENMLGAEVQELKQRAEDQNWTIARLDEHGVESNFPTDLVPVLRRKFRASQTHITQYLDSPKSFSIWELRGPIFWTVLSSLIAGSFIVSELAILSSLIILIPIYQYSKDAKLAASISGRWSFFILYPVYQILSAILRTAGVWINIDKVFVLMARRYLS